MTSTQWHKAVLAAGILLMLVPSLAITYMLAGWQLVVGILVCLGVVVMFVAGLIMVIRSLDKLHIT